MQQRFKQRWSVRLGVGTAFFMSHLLAGGIAVIVMAASQGVSWPVALFGASIAGWLLTLSLQRGLLLTELALQRLKDGLPIAEIPPRPRWPLTKLIALVDALGARERQYGALRQQMLTHTEQAAVQEERNRLARDLHDSIKQQLFSINIQAAAAQARWQHDPQAAQAAITGVRRSAHEAIVEMRALLQQLRPAPLETVGLVEALRDQAEALGYRSGARVTTHFGELPADDRLPPGAQDAIFRIAQEALSNVARHARADHVEVNLELGDATLLLLIRDDGQGFDPQHAGGGMGLGNMRERVHAIGGTMKIDSAPGSGTVLTVRVPLVEPVVQEDNMSAEAKALIKRATWWQAGSGIAQVVGYLVLAAMGLYSLASVGQPIWLGCLTILVLLVGGGLLCRRNARRIQRNIELNMGVNSAPAEQLRSMWHRIQYGALLIGAFVLPFMWLHHPNWIYDPVLAMVGFPFWNNIQQTPVSENVQWVAALQACFWAAFALFELIRYLRAEQRYWMALPAYELRPLLEKEIQSTRLSVIMFALLIPLQIYNTYMSTSNPYWSDPVFPPQTAGQLLHT